MSVFKNHYCIEVFREVILATVSQGEKERKWAKWDSVSHSDNWSLQAKLQTTDTGIAEGQWIGMGAR